MSIIDGNAMNLTPHANWRDVAFLGSNTLIAPPNAFLAPAASLIKYASGSV
jgi:hypothetical protein